MYNDYMNIKEFADQIGVSPATVSRALGDKGRVSTSTREMVAKKMKELGYYPNPHAKTLISGRNNVILLHHYDRDIFSDIFLVEITHGIQHALEETGYGLILDPTHSGAIRQTKAYSNPWINPKTVDGVIVKTVRPVRKWLSRYTSSGVPFVVLGDDTCSDLPDTTTVWVKLREAAGQAAEHLINLGHRKIAYIGTFPGDQLLEHFRESMNDHGLQLKAEHVITAWADPEAAYEAAFNLLSMPDRPTALFARLDTLAIAVIQAANALGLKVPGDVSVVGYGNIPISRFVTPPLTTVGLDFFELGRIAVHKLFDLMDNPSTKPDPTLLDTQLVIRGSTAHI